MKVGRVISISEYQNRDTVDTLEHLLVMAKEGKIKGLYFAANLGESDHHLGITGIYKQDPYSAYIPLARILDEIVQDIRIVMKSRR